MHCGSPVVPPMNTDSLFLAARRAYAVMHGKSDPDRQFVPQWSGAASENDDEPSLSRDRWLQALSESPAEDPHNGRAGDERDAT